MIALSFALPEESKDIVRHLSRKVRSGPAALPVIRGMLDGREVVIVHSGIGMASANARIGGFLEENANKEHANKAPSAWIAAGFGGGLSPDLKLGDIVTAPNFSDAALFASVGALTARAGAPAARAGALVTVKAAVETAVQKKDLGRHTGAIVVDMETAAIHRLCAARGIPTLAIRAISDTACQDLPIPAPVWFDAKKQRPRPVRLLLHLLLHPGRIAPFARFVRGVNRARASLTAFLLTVLPILPDL